MSDLETASIDDLIEEMKTRCDALVVGYARKGKLAGDLGTFSSNFYGGSIHCAGLARMLTLRLDRMIESTDKDAD